MKRLLTVLAIIGILFASFTGAVYADTIVYITKSGTKYHAANCRYLSKSKISISLSDAIARGYTPCSRCNAPRATHTHSWNGGVVTIAPTCANTGIRTYTCTTCGQTATETIPATGAHVWDGGRVTSAATCINTGIKTYTCSTCGTTRTESIPATGVHTWDNGKVTTPATCISAGVMTYTCTSCRRTSTKQIPLDPDAHQWECTEVITESVGDQHGYGVFWCKLCDASKHDEICPSANFVDVKNDWSHKPIDFAVNNKITTGTDPTHFRPNDASTRAQVVTFLWRLNGQPEPVTVNNPFVDVSGDAYYYRAVLWAAENNITTGLNDGTGRFGVDLPCTREQCVTFLYRSAGYPEVGTHQEFTDVEKGRYYYDSISWAASNGITVGLNDGTGRFGVGNKCTRAMIVTFIYRSAIQN